MMVVPVHSSELRSLFAKAPACGVACDDPSVCCGAGYFCVHNALCLRGSPSDYEDAAFIGVGVILGVVAGVEHISLTEQGVEDVLDSVDSALRTFEDWDGGRLDDAMGDLRALFGGLEKSWNACRSTASDPWWEKLVQVAARNAAGFFPEVQTVANGVEIVLHGENLYANYAQMRQDCGAARLRRDEASSGSYLDLVHCGIGIGGFGHEVHDILTDDGGDKDDGDRAAGGSIGATATMTLFSDGACALSTGSVTTPLDRCVPIPTCPDIGCPDLLRCVRPGYSLQQYFACLGCSPSPSRMSLRFSVMGSTLVEAIYYDDNCTSPIQAGNLTMDACVPATEELICDTGGASARITVAYE